MTDGSLLALPSGLVTFLMTDVEGSTQLWERYPQVMARALGRHDALIEACVRRNGGTLLKHRGEGDSTFTVFAVALQAACSAHEIQQAMAAEPWPAGCVLRVRAALHSDQLAPTGFDYFGPPVNRCARLRAAAYGGQTLLSEATNRLVGDRLPSTIVVRSLGYHRLRDLQRPGEIFQLDDAGSPQDFPALRSLDALPNNLPNQLTTFIGREAEMTEVRALLEHHRVLTINGPGGAGKTRLALQAAAEALPAHPDGVWFVELAEAASPEDVVRAAAAALHVREETGRSPLEQLVDRLNTERHLLVIDNCERQIDAAARLAEGLVTACPRVRILATSREPLGCRGEQLWSMPPLMVNGEADTEGATPGTGIPEAVRLFCDRASLQRRSFTLTPANAGAVADICRSLGGNALAIELAAARMDALSVQQIQHRLYQVLNRGPRTAPRRQQSLEATIRWSYDLLSPEERHLFDRLAVFAGGFTEEAVQHVASDLGRPVDTVLESLATLVRKTLVAPEDARDGSMRYRLHAVLRQFAELRLRERSGAEVEATRRMHADYYLALAERAEPKLISAEQSLWLGRLDQDLDNLRAAVRHLVASRRAVDARRMTGALWRFWYLRGLFVEGLEQLMGALALDAADDSPAVRAKALHGAGTLASHLGDLDSAQAYLVDALNRWEDLADQVGLKNTLNNLGMVAQERGELHEALALYRRCLAVNERLGDPWGTATAMGNLASVGFTAGEYDTAAEYAARGFALQRDLGDRSARASSHLILGAVDQKRGNYASAASHFEAALRDAREVGDRSTIAEILRHQGDLDLACRDLAAAQVRLEESLLIFRALGLAQYAAYALESLGRLARAEGDLPTARARLAEARALGSEARGDEWRADLAEGEGWLALYSNALAEAHGQQAKALRLRNGLVSPWNVLRSLEAMSCVAAAEGDGAAALRLDAAVLTIRERASLPRTPQDGVEIARFLDLAIPTLTAAQRRAARQAGSRLTRDEAVNLALERKT